MSKYLLIVLVCLVYSCHNNSEHFLEEMETFSPEERIWAHKINSLDSINERVEEFKGIEIDVFYIEETNKFEIKRVINSEGLDLELFLDSIIKVKELYFWFDYKNLNEHTNAGISKLHSILNTRKLLGKSFVESYFSDDLMGFKDKLTTSFWISSPIIPTSKLGKDSLYKKLQYIEKCNINMLSADFRMFEFVTEYFPDYKCNYWIFHSLTKVKRDALYEILDSPNTNVILIDGKVNILK